MAVFRLIASSNFVGCRTGKSAAFYAIKNTTDIDARLVVLIDHAGAVAHQAAGRRKFAPIYIAGTSWRAARATIVARRLMKRAFVVDKQRAGSPR